VLLAYLGYKIRLSKSYWGKNQGRIFVIHNDAENMVAANMTNPNGAQNSPTFPVKEVEMDEADELDEDLDKAALEQQKEDLAALERLAAAGQLEEVEDVINLDEIENILELDESQYPRFTLAKNKARFMRMVSWYRQKEEWIEVAPVSGVTKLFKQQTKELEGIRSSKLDYEMELETGTLTPSQRSYRKDELKMCKVQEKMAVHLISKLQIKIKSGRR
jgi:hypothetical protein